jgi:hypothetical protein
MTKLTSGEIARYHDQGWIVPDYRVPDAMLRRAQERATTMMATRPDYRDLYPDILGTDITFIEMAREPDLVVVLEQIIGPDIALWTAGMFGKPAGDGKATPWHQDGEYWPIRPLKTTTVWVALDASTRGNGCLRVIPGSHKYGRLFGHHENLGENLTLHQEINYAEFDETTAVDIKLEAGQVSIHDVYLIHGSAPNQSDKRRAGMTYRYMPASCHFDRALAARQATDDKIPNISKRPIYLVHGTGESAPNTFDPVPSAINDAA